MWYTDIINRTNIRGNGILGGGRMIVFLTNAMNRKEKIMIYYMDSKDEVSQRIIRVVQLGDEKILAYCYYRKQVRNFKIDNILSYGRLKGRMGA